MRERRMSKKSQEMLNKKIDAAIISITDRAAMRRLIDKPLDKYEFTRAEVLPADSHKAINRARLSAASLVGASSVSWTLAVFDLVTLDWEWMMMYGAGGIATSAISTVIYGRLLPRMNAKAWVNGMNNLLGQVVLSRPVTVTEKDMLESAVKKDIGGGGHVVIRTKKTRARRAGPDDIVGSVEIKFPSDHANEFDTVLDSVLTNDPDVAKALEAVEKKQLPPTSTRKWF